MTKWDYDESVKKIKQLKANLRKFSAEILGDITIAEKKHGIPVSKFCHDTGLDTKRINKLVGRIN
jgi:hypothetical protein